ncbi:MAG: sodium-independent anion transporter, partial [Psychromonas sp.]
MIDVTVGLALENAIKDALDTNCEVLLLCPNMQTRQQLEKFHVLDLIEKKNNYLYREQALQAALTHVS